MIVIGRTFHVISPDIRALDLVQVMSSAHSFNNNCIYQSTVFLKKNIPDIFSYNFRKHCRIFIMFGTPVTEKVSNQ